MFLMWRVLRGLALEDVSMLGVITHVLDLALGGISRWTFDCNEYG